MNRHLRINRFGSSKRSLILLQETNSRVTRTIRALDGANEKGCKKDHQSLHKVGREYRCCVYIGNICQHDIRRIREDGTARVRLIELDLKVKRQPFLANFRYAKQTHAVGRQEIAVLPLIEILVHV